MNSLKNSFNNYLLEGPQTIKCLVVAVDTKLYTSIVVKDLERSIFLTTTVFPSWQGYIPQVGDTGYMVFNYCHAGRTEWYNKAEEKIELFKNTYFQFQQFIKDEPIVKNKITM